MKKIILALLVFGFTFSSSAQDQEKPYVAPKHFLGVHAGFTTGRGLSYRYWPSKFGGEITAAPRFKKGGQYSISTGLSLLYKLKETKRYTAYAYVGNSLLATKAKSESYNPITQISTYKIKETTIYNASLGLGYKINFWDNLDFNVQLGYGFYEITTDFNTNITSEISMYYHF